MAKHQTLEEIEKEKAEEAARLEAEEAAKMPVSPWENAKMKRVKVHFLVDYMVDGRKFKCNEYAEIPECYKGIVDNGSVEAVKEAAKEPDKK